MGDVSDARAERFPPYHGVVPIYARGLFDPTVPPTINPSNEQVSHLIRTDSGGGGPHQTELPRAVFTDESEIAGHPTSQEAAQSGRSSTNRPAMEGLKQEC